jgi:hypothetical protein
VKTSRSRNSTATPSRFASALAAVRAAGEKSTATTE